jgi:hypothetical protein
LRCISFEKGRAALQALVIVGLVASLAGCSRSGSTASDAPVDTTLASSASAQTVAEASAVSDEAASAASAAMTADAAASVADQAAAEAQQQPAPVQTTPADPPVPNPVADRYRCDHGDQNQEGTVRACDRADNGQ